MADPDSTEDVVRKAAMDLLTEGKATLSEIAELAGVSRQLAWYWASMEEIDWQKARKAALAREWRKKLGKK